MLKHTNVFSNLKCFYGFVLVKTLQNTENTSYRSCENSELTGLIVFIDILLDNVFPRTFFPCSMLDFRDGNLPSLSADFRLTNGGTFPSFRMDSFDADPDSSMTQFILEASVSPSVDICVWMTVFNLSLTVSSESFNLESNHSAIDPALVG